MNMEYVPCVNENCPKCGKKTTSFVFTDFLTEEIDHIIVACMNCYSWDQMINREQFENLGPCEQETLIGLSGGC